MTFIATHYSLLSLSLSLSVRHRNVSIIPHRRKELDRADTQADSTARTDTAPYSDTNARTHEVRG